MESKNLILDDLTLIGPMTDDAFIVPETPRH
jgi:hypothetical protein